MSCIDILSILIRFAVEGIVARKLNDEQIEFFKKQLEQQKKEILHDMDNLKKDLISSEKNSDMSDVATTYELQQLELKRADRERKLLNKINVDSLFPYNLFFIIMLVFFFFFTKQLGHFLCPKRDF